eukprot:m.131802 g.131802  ORF g.131802 m.131802 type:complete len:96 (+) comp38053_c0_seq6:26-313(+)
MKQFLARCRKCWMSTHSAPFIRIQSADYKRDEMTNITSPTIDRIDRQLHRKHAHPINIVKSGTSRANRLPKLQWIITYLYSTGQYKSSGNSTSEF